MIFLKEIIEASLDQLIEMDLHFCNTDPLRAYMRSRLLYLQGDDGALSSHIKQFPENGEDAWLYVREASRIRLATQRQEVIKPNLISENDLWKLELYSVLSQYYDEMKKDYEANLYARKAYLLASKLGLEKRSAAMFQNQLAALSRLSNSKSLVCQFQAVRNRAESIGEIGTEAMSNVNIAEEFRKFGALNLSLDYVNRGVSLLFQNRFGTYDYYFALNQRSRILRDMGLIEEAICDENTVSDSKYLQIRNREKWPRIEGPLLTTTESRFIEILSTGPKSKHDIINVLYGENNRFFVLENRFKQLVFRLKKKKPSMINQKDGKFYLNEALGGENFVSA